MITFSHLFVDGQHWLGFSIVDYMMEQLTLWERSLNEIPDSDTQASTENK